MVDVMNESRKGDTEEYQGIGIDSMRIIMESGCEMASIYLGLLEILF
jgi:hypothetical protein